MKKALVINGNPDSESFCYSLAENYKNEALASGHKCEVVHLFNLDFNPILKAGYKSRTPLEPDLQYVKRQIENAQHLVFIYPIWWGSMPALLKGFIDRVFLPGWAFQYRKNSALWDKLLLGKTARLIVTMDSPLWYNALKYRNAGIRSLRTATLAFCGIHPVKVSSFGSIKNTSKVKREAILNKVRKLGAKLN